ncbi:hypothetical protein [Parasphingorhabdus sp.]|uniref:hypothetical protein n=1 Tax=Parasphingorhabdus sp. TaxID=2709688 RepID=UPI0035943DF5
MNGQRSRPLILRDEGIRHPFRQSLPIEIVQIARKEQDSQVALAGKEKGLAHDASLFLLSFLAFFTAFSTFIF